ncbi:MAG: molybdopterin-dependent oxidoreductase [Rhodothermales bacterium]|nr:molybdopterin-dependent oxidoreductase [Rhodothermales bacterium]
MTTRRNFIKQSGGLVIGASILSIGGCDSIAVEPVGKGIDFPFLTPTENFFLQFGGDGALQNWPGIQQIPRGNWRLAIDGLVGTPKSLSYSDLDADDSLIRTILASMRCILDNNAVPGLIGTATWTGVPLYPFLEQAGMDLGSAKRLRFYGADGFTNNIKIEKVWPNASSELSEPLLVFGMNSSPLRPEHGGPVRLLVPGHYGYKSIKWVERIEVTADETEFGTYQEVLGYEDDGSIDVTCKTTSHLRGARIDSGRVQLAGFALSGLGGVSGLLVSIDGSEFEPARILSLAELVAGDPLLGETLQAKNPTLFSYPFAGVWSFWEFIWNAVPGEHSIRVKASDSAGNEQPEIDTDPTDGLNPIVEFSVSVE